MTDLISSIMNSTSTPTMITQPMDNTSTPLDGSSNPRFSFHVKILLGLLLGLVDMITILGNLVVLLSFVIEPKLRSTFNTYIINLAVTDILVGLTAMSFYTIDTLLGRWPFGEFLCGFWIFFDYGMTFASVFTLVAISVDRFWSIFRSVHYRNNNTSKKCIITLATVWISVLAVWLAPCIVDRIKWSSPNSCKWEPSNNREFVIFVAIVGHHMPCIMLITCYIKVFLFMRSKQMRISPQQRNTVAHISTSGPETSTETNHKTGAQTRHVVKANKDKMTTSVTIQTNATAKVTTRGEKEKRIFVTLSYIIISYLVCWVPFHIVFDISAVDPTLVPESIYTITFWMTYLNSTLNPFLYAFGSVDFRRAFKRVVLCQFRQQHRHEQAFTRTEPEVTLVQD